MMLKTLTLLLLCAITNLCFATALYTPSPFITSGKKAVWANFKSANYEIVLDTINKRAQVKTSIDFEITQAGHPIFDLVNSPTHLLVNGNNYKSTQVDTPDGVSKVRIINHKFSAGKYTLDITSSIDHGIAFTKNGVSLGFFMKDMKDRQFLERYLPANYEYDQYAMNISVKIVGTSGAHEAFTNGEIVTKEDNYFEIKYPDYFTSSSLYLHLTPKAKFKRIDYTHTNLDGSEFPVTIYSKHTRLNRRLKQRTKKILKELERDYGPWPHPQLILYGTGKLRGGMEYAGAAVTSWFALGHELQHNYFARAVMPADGNAGWIDEAVASWRDFFSLSAKKPNYDTMNLGNHSQYMRKTDVRSYKSGRSFMSYLSFLLKNQETDRKLSLKGFLKVYYNKYKFKTVTSEIFRNELETYARRSFKNEFKRFIYGSEETLSKGEDHRHHENHYHPSISDQDIEEIL